MKNLFWTKQLDGSYRAAPGGHTYTIILEPRPVDRYVARVDGEVQRAVGGPQAGQRLLFWYLREAKAHCQDLADGLTGLTQNTEKQTRAIRTPPPTAVPFPTEDQVIAAVRAVTGSEGRTWPIVDQAREVLAAGEAKPTTQTKAVLETYVLEVAKWGRIRRWLTEGDILCAALALWDVRDQIVALRGRNYSEPDIADAVMRLYNNLIGRMRERGITKTHFSLASKILHWLLPACAPVYDSLVLQELQITAAGSEAYRQIVTWEYKCAQALQPSADKILNGIRELTLLAAIDNFLWRSAKSQP